MSRSRWGRSHVTRSAGGSWLYPQLHAWITRWDYAGFICEPAQLHIRGYFISGGTSAVLRS
jgi:hypothetical protein